MATVAYNVAPNANQRSPADATRPFASTTLSAVRQPDEQHPRSDAGQIAECIQAAAKRRDYESQRQQRGREGAAHDQTPVHAKSPTVQSAPERALENAAK